VSGGTLALVQYFGLEEPRSTCCRKKGRPGHCR
jgi:hypothetical protein